MTIPLPAAAVFDLDDTLYSFGSAHAAAMVALSPFAAPLFSLSEEAFRDEVAATLREQKELSGGNAGFHSRCVRFQRMLEKRGLPLRLAPRIAERYRAELLARIEPAPGAAELLAGLRARGVRVGIGTDMTAEMQFLKMEKLGLVDSVDFVVSSEEAGVEKPGPAFFALVAAKAGCAPDRILFAGDNLEKDVLGAAAAGMRGVWTKSDPAARAARPNVPSVASLPELAAALFADGPAA